MIKLAIHGACGRMGRRIAALVQEDGDFEIVAAVEGPTCPQIGQDYGQIVSGTPSGLNVADGFDPLQANPTVIIDFSQAQAVARLADAAVKLDAALVSGTTGLADEQLDALHRAAETVPVLHAANMSVGMNLLFELVGRVAAALGDDYDIEISETHHRFKKDAPSGSAMTVLKSICAATGRDPRQVAQFGRRGADAVRQRGQIGMHALRIGDTVGEHCVHFGNLGETVYIGHSAHSRDTFARGALRAAKWIVGKKPGLYSMQEVLFGAARQ